MSASIKMGSNFIGGKVPSAPKAHLDLIVFIYREEVYKPDTPRKGIADISIAKQRNGPIGDFPLTFVGRFTKFENWVPETYADEAYQ